MKPFATTFRCLLVAVTAAAVLAAPVSARSTGGCKNDGVKVDSHSAKCCCGVFCHCTHCPAADSSKHTPAPTPSAPDEGRVVVKTLTLALDAAVVAVEVPAPVLETAAPSFEIASFAHTLLDLHTLLRV